MFWKRKNKRISHIRLNVTRVMGTPIEAAKRNMYALAVKLNCEIQCSLGDGEFLIIKPDGTGLEYVTYRGEIQVKEFTVRP